MKRIELESEVKTIVMDISGNWCPNPLPDDSLIDDLGVDSLDMFQIIDTVETRFGISISENELAPNDVSMEEITLRKLYDLVERKVKEKQQ